MRSMKPRAMQGRCLYKHLGAPESVRGGCKAESAVVIHTGAVIRGASCREML